MQTSPTDLNYSVLRSAIQRPSARPSTRIRPFAVASSNQPSRNAVTAPGAPSLPSGQSAGNDNSTYPSRHVPLIALLLPSSPDHVPLTLFPSRVSFIDPSKGPASLPYRTVHSPDASAPFFTGVAAIGVTRTFEK